MRPASSRRASASCAQVLSRLEDETSGKIKPQELHVEIPAQRIAQAKRTAEILGDAVYAKFPMVDGMKPMASDLSELVLNRTWRPALSITGVGGIAGARFGAATCCVRTPR